ncbi:MAG TPA: hypothetical protein PLW09_05825, partial [Candidatus Kapabacteria bacterium]|nr:hypothetical protein [Candidatus Kapabacteria bacterium]
MSCLYAFPAYSYDSHVKTFALGYGDNKSRAIHLRWFVTKEHCIPNEGYTILRKKHGSPMIHQIVG